MNKNWTVCRIRQETKKRIEDMTSKDIGFDESIRIILDDYTKLLDERIVHSKDDLTPIQEPITVHEVTKVKETTDANLLIEYFERHPDKNLDDYSDKALDVMAKMLREDYDK